MTWTQDKASDIKHYADYSSVSTASGNELQAKIVIDTSGHQPVFLKRPINKSVVSYQAAYGVVGRFSSPPIDSEQFVLMDYRSDHLTAEDKRLNPPTFLYAMDRGNDIYFVEETSLSASPPVGFDVLERRLHERLAARGVSITEVHEV